MSNFLNQIGFNKKPVEEPPAEGQSFEELMKMMQGFMGEMANIRTEITNLQKAREGQHPAPQNEFEGQPKPPATRSPRLHDMHEEDLAMLDEKSKFKMLETGIREDLAATVKEIIGPVSKQISDLSARTATSSAVSEIARVESERGDDGKLLRPDFADWKPLMAEMQKKAPGLSIPELYETVKHMNKDTEIGKQIAAKYTSDEVSKPKDNVIAWNGLAPNLMQKTVDGGDLSIDDAASKALVETKEAYGEIPPATKIPAS